MNKRVRRSQSMNSITRKSADASREIVVDSRASENLIYNIALLKSIEEVYPVEVGLENGHTFTARCKGWINVMLGNLTNLTLGNVYFIPELRLNLMACHCLERSGSSRSFLADSVDFIRG